MIDNMIRPIRVAVTGTTGRMGTEIIRCIIESRQQKEWNNKIILGAALVRSQSIACGIDIGTLMKTHIQDISITDDISSIKDNFDVLIDFTHPDITTEYLKFCMINNKNMIIGTTGLNKKHQNLIKVASKKIGILCSSNFSIGITIMLRLLTEVSKTIGNMVDIDIIESHHNKKNDTPSGTALMIKDVIQSNITKTSFFQTTVINNNYNSNKIYTSNKLSKSDDDISIHSIRSGDIVGEHTVFFSSTGERLEIKHQAFSRKIFAYGALYAAIWLGSSKIGLFNLNDMFGI